MNVIVHLAEGIMKLYMHIAKVAQTQPLSSDRKCLVQCRYFMRVYLAEIMEVMPCAGKTLWLGNGAQA